MYCERCAAFEGRENAANYGDGSYRFEEFVFDPRLHALLRRGERVPLTPKTLDVLSMLVGRAGQVVTREELIEAVWPDSFVQESNLTQTVFMLRKALGRDSARPYIATVQGRGYRFIAPVQSLESYSERDSASASQRSMRRSGTIHMSATLA